MPSNKKRLYVALYPSGVVNNEERKYHWGFIIGPKKEPGDPTPGMRYHVKNAPIGGWKYEEIELRNVRHTTNLLARIVIAKIIDEERLVHILRNTPVVQNDPDWRCRTWVADVLRQLQQDGRAVGTAELDWRKIETRSRKFVETLNSHGRYSDVSKMDLPRPTWDLLEGRQIIP